MISKKEFIKEIETTFDLTKLSAEAQEYWTVFTTDKKKDKPKFTDNGKLILKFMQTTMEKGKAKDIAEAMFISSRSVSGAMRKLVTDGFVEKIGEDPIIYCITEKGRNIEID